MKPDPDTPLKSGDEYDAFTRWRRLMNWKAGQIARIKRRYNKRVRQKAKATYDPVED